MKGDQTDSAAPQTAATAAKPAAPPKPVAAPAAPRNAADLGQCQRQPAALAGAAIGAGCGAAAADGCDQSDANRARAAAVAAATSCRSPRSRPRIAPHASYRVLQSKYGSVLGSRSPVIKRVDLTDKGKGIVYRAFAGPYGSAEEATQACNSLKSAGLSACFVQRN